MGRQGSARQGEHVINKGGGRGRGVSLYTEEKKKPPYPPPRFRTMFKTSGRIHRQTRQGRDTGAGQGIPRRSKMEQGRVGQGKASGRKLRMNQISIPTALRTKFFCASCGGPPRAPPFPPLRLSHSRPLPLALPFLSLFLSLSPSPPPWDSVDARQIPPHNISTNYSYLSESDCDE